MAARPAMPDDRPMARLSSLALLTAVAVLFGMSGGVLWRLGYNYDGLTGSALSKIHPFTYMVAALVLWRAVAFGNPVGYLVHVARRRPAALLVIVLALVMLVTTVLRQGPGMAGFIDTYIGPALLVVLLADASAKTLVAIEVLLHAIMTANALLALEEFATKTLVFPYRLDGVVFPFDLRSSALQGHALVNALVTACYILALVNGCRGLPPAARLGLIGLQGAALVAFGGRIAALTVIVFGGAYLVAAAFRTLRGGRVSLLGAATAVLLLGAVPILVGGAAEGGFFDALLSRFVADGGSANARVEMFEIVRSLPLRDLIVGPNIDLVESLRRISGLEWGIENPVVRMTLYQGAFLTLVMAIGVALFLRELVRPCHTGIWLPMAAFVLLLNTSESIAVKTTIMAKFAIITCLYRRRVSPVVAAPRPARARPVRVRREFRDRELA